MIPKRFGFTALGNSGGAGKKKGKPVFGLPLPRSPAAALGSLPSVALSSGRAKISLAYAGEIRYTEWYNRERESAAIMNQIDTNKLINNSRFLLTTYSD
jgi:hypothetical protein